MAHLGLLRHGRRNVILGLKNNPLCLFVLTKIMTYVKVSRIWKHSVPGIHLFDLDYRLK